MNTTQSMTSNQPYLLRAIYEWIADNHMTPHILVNAGYPGVHVPGAYVRENKIVFNIAESAVRKLRIGNEAIEFEARFGGVAQRIYAPTAAVIAIYAQENGAGMSFSEPAWQGGVVTNDKPSDTTAKPSSKKKPDLRLIKKD